MTELASKLSGKRKHTKKWCFPWLDRLRIWYFIQLCIIVIAAVFVTEPTVLCESFFGTLLFSAYSPFLIISGFIVTYDLLSEKKRYGSFQIIYFWLRRAVTLVPLILALIAVGAWVLPMLEGGYCAAGDGLLWEEISGVWQLRAPSAYPFSNLLSWTVVVLLLLMCFYLIWPLVLWLLPIKQHLWAEIIMITLSLLFRAGFFSDFLPLPYHLFSTILPFMLGAIIARQFLLYSASFLRFRTYRKGMAIIAMVGGFTCVGLISMAGEYSHLYILGELLLMLSTLLLIALASTAPRKRGIEVDFNKEQRWLVPVSMAMVLSLGATWLPVDIALQWKLLLQSVILIPLFFWVSKTWVFPYFQSIREKYTFRNEK